MKRFFVVSLLLLISVTVLAAQTVPSVDISIKGGDGKKGEIASTIKIALLLTILALTPAILMMMTAFTRILISFHFLRQAMGIQGVPPNQVVIGITLFMTLFVMSPVAMKINRVALEPYNQGKVSEMEALKLAGEPLKEFMIKQTREKDLALFYDLSKTPRPANEKEISMIVLLPAFILSELKTAFMIGFLLYIPFLIIDTIVAAILVSMGMMFLPPMMISMPFKIVLFILADGWALLTRSLITSFNM